MKNRSKALVLCICTLALIVSGVFTTLAYFTHTTEKVVNTFTFGNVTITLDEADVKPDGTLDTEERVTANSYKLFPGHTYDKDPTVHVDAESEDCWVFIKVANGIGGENGIEAATEVDGYQNIAKQITDNGWVAVENQPGVYVYNSIATKSDADLVVFEEFMIAADVTEEKLVAFADAEITVTAYAIQADGLTTKEAAWTAISGAITIQ